MATNTRKRAKASSSNSNNDNDGVTESDGSPVAKRTRRSTRSATVKSSSSITAAAAAAATKPTNKPAAKKAAAKPKPKKQTKATNNKKKKPAAKPKATKQKPAACAVEKEDQNDNEKDSTNKNNDTTATTSNKKPPLLDSSGNRIIELEDGWNNEIKPKAIAKLEDMLDTGGLVNHNIKAGAAVVGSSGVVSGTSPDGSNGQTAKIFGPSEYVQIYTTCYDMCTQQPPHNWAAELYKRHGETIEQYLTTKVVPTLKDKKGLSGPILLDELHLRWTNHQIMNKWLQKFFCYVDRYHVKHSSLPTLTMVGLTRFKEHCFDVIKQDASEAILALIRDEREGAIIDKSIVKSIVELYEQMGLDNSAPSEQASSSSSLEVYVSDLEEPLLEATRSHYIKKRSEWMANDSTPDYCIKAEAALNAERTRVQDYLNSSSERKILAVVDVEILEAVQMELLEKEASGCRALLQNEKSEDLQRLFRLFSRVENGLVPMADMVGAYILTKGKEVTKSREARLEGGEKDKNDDPKFVLGMIDLHRKSLATVKRDFGGHALFHKALKDAFVEIVNANVGQFTNAELLSTFCDRILKNGGAKLSEADVEENLDRIVELFCYLTDKDLFAEIYRNQLAKRLLSQRSTGNDAEKLMIAKLKVQCGTQFTSKMEGMLNDLSVGGQQRQDFERHVRKVDTKIDFGVQVLTNGNWPTYKSPEVTLPTEMTKCLDVFKEWHDQKHQKRKLAWMMTQGNATVRATFGKKSYDLQVTTLQAIALHALSGGETISFEDLAQRLNLQDDILKPIMHSLSCGKLKVISKTPASNKINTTDTFTANSKFQSNMRKIRIPMASLDASFNKNKVEENRSVYIDAAIVRIMKARKTLQHQQLLSEILSQLAFFSPNPRVVKKRIETLIEREYLERSTTDKGAYNYLA